MCVIVAKFGGSSINDSVKLDLACSTISSFVSDANKVVAVVSAIRGVTDLLKDTIDRITKDNFDICISQCTERLRALHSYALLSTDDLSYLERLFFYFVESDKKKWVEDQILVMGEEFSSRIFTSKLNEYGIDTDLINFNDPKFPTTVHGYFGNSRIDLSKTKDMCVGLVSDLENYSCICIPGFGGIDRDSGRVKNIEKLPCESVKDWRRDFSSIGPKTKASTKGASS